MNCDDIADALYVYLDGEFAGPEEADFEAHLDRCPSCRHNVEREAAFLTRVKLDAPQAALPDGLRDRVVAALAKAPAPDVAVETRRASRRPWLGWTLPLAAAALLGVLWWQGAGDPEGDRAVTDIVAAHQHTLPMDTRGSQDQILDYIRSNASFAVNPPFVGVPGVTLIGARLIRVDGRDAVLLNYEDGGQRLSVIQMAAQTREPPTVAQPLLRQHRGYDVMTFNRAGVQSAVVGEGPSVRRLVRAAYRPGQ